VAPEQVPLWVNAADAVVVPSDREGFGLAVLEALACDVPVLATPVGIHTEALAGLAGVLCEPFSLERWSGALAATLEDEDPRVEGRSRACDYSSDVMAERVRGAWEHASAQRR
jgi:glycosyltransferase involved in cell wall biosynthesis